MMDCVQVINLNFDFRNRRVRRTTANRASTCQVRNHNGWKEENLTFLLVRADCQKSSYSKSYDGLREGDQFEFRFFWE